jgi:DNA repair exonuclease SbcCD ATPase subunit
MNKDNITMSKKQLNRYDVFEQGQRRVYITDLQYKVKSLERRVAEFESGAKYKKMRSAQRKQLGEKDHEIAGLKQELADAHGETSTIRKYWQQGTCDLEREHAAALRKMERRIKKMEDWALSAERSRDEFHGSYGKRPRNTAASGQSWRRKKGRTRSCLPN